MSEPIPKILIIEDDAPNRRMLKALLGSFACEILEADAGNPGLALAKEARPQAVLLDLGLPDMPGLQVLERLHQSQPELPILVLTGDTEVPTAVRAIQLGAFNYFTKPISTDQVLAAVRAAVERSQLRSQVLRLQSQLQGRQDSLASSMGPSAGVRRLQDQVQQVAGTLFTVLVHGETGSGKEVVSRAIHDQSPRASKPFIALDCGAIPENLLESELFGYEKGAFTGAEKRKEGHFILAQGGTLFLDEIANLPLGLQAKMLRVLQERELRPLGGTKPVSLDVRLVAASNHDLEQEVEAGRFRQDLFFRLAEFRIEIPSLRERKDDIAYLAQRFLEEARVELRRPVAGFSSDALALMGQQPWKGNVRELRNVVRQAVLQCDSALLEASHLAPMLKKGSTSPFAAVGLTGSLRQIGEDALASAEKSAIAQALRASRGNILQAARALHTDNKTLHVKLKKYGIRARDYEPEESA
jgi:DNA-binding NtrC family response regulator